jgi:DNA polymerase I-like protein with 3'-5' exonuclease and polymerase domains
MLLQIHDELLLEAQGEELAATAKVVRRVMEGVVSLKIPRGGPQGRSQLGRDVSSGKK